MRIAPLLLLCATLTASAGESRDLDRERRLLRQELERAGIRVDHHADTPGERARELREIRRQLERARQPQVLRRVGGSSGSSSRSSSRIRKAPPIGKLGAGRKL